MNRFSIQIGYCNCPYWSPIRDFRTVMTHFFSKSDILKWNNFWIKLHVVYWCLIYYLTQATVGWIQSVLKRLTTILATTLNHNDNLLMCFRLLGLTSLFVDGTCYWYILSLNIFFLNFVRWILNQEITEKLFKTAKLINQSF